MSQIQKRSRQTGSPWSLLSQIEDEWGNWFGRPLDRLFEWGQPGGLLDRACWPPVEVIDEGPAYVVNAELPGQDRDKVAVTVRGGVLTIEGEMGSRTEGVSGDVLRNECAGGKFHRTIGFPAHVDASKVDARYRDGVLTVRLPKQESHVPRQIDVSVS